VRLHPLPPGPSASRTARGLLLAPLLLAVLLLHGLQCGAGAGASPDPLAVATAADQGHLGGAGPAVVEGLHRSVHGLNPSVDGLLPAVGSPGPHHRHRHGAGHLMQVCFALLVAGLVLSALVAGALRPAPGGQRPGSDRGSDRQVPRAVLLRPPDLVRLCVSRT